jgi:hypothetical protein
MRRSNSFSDASVSGALAQITRSSCSTRSSRSSRSTTSVTKPAIAASDDGIRPAVSSSAIVRPAPRRCWRRAITNGGRVLPSVRATGAPKTASGVATTKSQHAANASPAPTAGP